MKRTWLVAAAMAAGLNARTQDCDPAAWNLTVFVDAGKASVPNMVLARGKYVAAQVLAGAGLKVEWMKGQRPDPQRDYCGELFKVVFDAQAPAGFAPRALASASLNPGSAVEIHIFYDRVAAFPDGPRMPEFLGHVLAHEIVHILQGAARHSDQGVMKAHWDPRDCAELARRPLPFAPEDLELIQQHFEQRGRTWALAGPTARAIGTGRVGK